MRQKVAQRLGDKEKAGERETEKEKRMGDWGREEGKAEEL